MSGWARRHTQDLNDQLSGNLARWPTWRQLVSNQTRHLQERVWKGFQTWVAGQISPEAAAQLFLCPQVATAILANYGKFLFLGGAPLYEFRHLLVLVQQNFAGMRQHLGPAWRVLTQWEEVQPLTHRKPLPELLFKAMFSIAMCWNWKRFAATLLLAVEGIARIGEVLQATREDLVLPSDVFDNSRPVAFLRVKKPKTFRRGKGRVQHLKISNEQVILVLERIFGPLDFSLRLFPHSASAFRRRWEKILDTLGVPRTLRPTPAGVRGGGAILAYKRGEAIQDIMWRMRLVSQSTLESYLQELAAESLLAKLPAQCRSRIRSAASFFPCVCSHLAKPTMYARTQGDGSFKKRKGEVPLVSEAAVPVCFWMIYKLPSCTFSLLALHGAIDPRSLKSARTAKVVS